MQRQQDHKQTKEDWKYVEVTSIRKEWKIIRKDDFGSKLTLNHPFSMDNKKKGEAAGVWEGEKIERKTKQVNNIFVKFWLKLFWF